ncbi:hypothetical protein VOLCADRAFT_120693 [Volvox carteri f. nagariensis]|uniref:Thioredoxin domain-containing protein n=1 Tax=Volvox carteri f. nagariensis TaxID=3068 RepID=D8TRC4_VOLCA|nr:uncharacterized protein VOLCADRAFT_120693 [Volvox carteri f. nagariensis]EFJ49970.1 hypothetical protein VOLCADRAFT_120693 [Volvox carteri f. nagariensis]|eukprot:XP_002949035.1 hypothetical protein VOLCADRAFT_120693 [Volvox carteri f. nagariensis]
MTIGAVFGLLILANILSPSFAGSAVVDLTDEDFDAKTSTGVWMIKVYAPWCPECRKLEPLWQAFAEEAEADGLSVGKVNGDSERALLARFRVNTVPRFYLLREGRTYEYMGPRNIMAFRSFATSGYRTAKPLPFHRAPNSALGRVIGRFYSLPRLGMRVYRLLRDQHGLSDTAIVLGFLAIPVVVGGLLICALDAMYLRRAKDEFGPEHEHQE